MIYKAITLECRDELHLRTEIMFNIASERVAGTKLVRFDIYPGEGEKNGKAALLRAMRILKEMKGRGAIQFVATKESFEKQSREAMFLLNKFQQYVNEENILSELGAFVYVSI